MMSALASTPSQPAFASATISASSVRRRSAIANGSPGTPSMPRAVWSAATMNNLPSVSNGRR